MRAAQMGRWDIQWTSYDIAEEVDAKYVKTVHWKFDFLEASGPKSYGYHEFDVVITNPPYSLAEAFLERCIPIGKIVVFLLRLGFLASKQRYDLFRRIGVPSLYVLPNRPSFTNGGTDQTDYAWYVWDNSDNGPKSQIHILGLTSLEERNSDYELR